MVLARIPCMTAPKLAQERPERRRIDREEVPAGAAAEAAITRTIELHGADAALEPEVAKEEAARARGTLLSLAVGAAGIVYGDIGTSPLYALREAFTGYGLRPVPADVLGVLSLIVWALVLVVSVKYIAFIMRADNGGEGGILALLTLLLPDLERGRSRRPMLWIGAGLFGAALLYGDGVITPAISVLSAVEGLHVVSPALQRFVVPLTLAILVSLFAIQRRGTARVGRVFGPVMVLWFVVIGAMGAVEVARHPGVLGALSPVHAASFLVRHSWPGLMVLGAVILVVTGAEALYADMGHFGARPIRLVWFVLVLPCLLLNYLGQGSLLLRAPATQHPFFELAPARLLLPLVALATITTVIASQALISGAFSLTRQLMHLGYAPILTVLHTSQEQEGQVYVPIVNWLLLAACLLLVVGFGSSERLATAYGLAVSATMALTTVLFYRVARWRWGWSRIAALPLALLFLLVDLSFLTANVVKLPHGGWVPLVLAIGVYVVFVTWRRGRDQLIALRSSNMAAVEEMVARVAAERPARTPGTGIFLSPSADQIPDVLHHYVERIRSLHEQIILITVRAADAARVPAAERVEIERLEHGFITVVACYGYMQSVALQDVLRACERKGVCRLPESPTYFLARERLRPTGAGRMARWRKRIFIFMHHNAPTMQDFFALPMPQVLELGVQHEL
ncbi:MAG: kup [Gemmatimonadetes bacterium]|jgi:KUP system potassium uptake protein|nr:kup [Gemmatimonadota bacterium]